VKLRQIAIQAVLDLVATSQVPRLLPWCKIDKIERRFKIVGCADAAIIRQEKAHAQYIRDWVERNVPWDKRFSRY